MTSHVLRAAGSRSNTHRMSSRIASNIVISGGEFCPTILVKLAGFAGTFLCGVQDAAEDVDFLVLQACAREQPAHTLHQSLRLLGVEEANIEQRPLEMAVEQFDLAMFR